jgi:Lar family restriction alleviation protein
MTDELKPCPFCGGAPRLLRLVETYPAVGDKPAGEYDAWFNVTCDNCGIEQGDEYRSSAITAWNRRASLPQPAAQGEPVGYASRAAIRNMQRGIQPTATLVPKADAADDGDDVPLYASLPPAVRGLTQREVDAIYALRHADDWISHQPHGDNCFVSDHYPGDPGNRCNCGKDSALQAVNEALCDYPESMDDDGEPLEVAAASAPKTEGEKPRFAHTYCSQCGGEFGPGDAGYSHCVDHPQPGDKLDMAYINSLPQPFCLRQVGDKEWWPVHDIEVETGLVRIDVCGRLQVLHVGDAAQFRDGSGKLHDAEDFYTDSERASPAPAAPKDGEGAGALDAAEWKPLGKPLASGAKEDGNG